MAKFQPISQAVKLGTVCPNCQKEQLIGQSILVVDSGEVEFWSCCPSCKWSMKKSQNYKFTQQYANRPAARLMRKVKENMPTISSWSRMITAMFTIYYWLKKLKA